MQGFAFVDWDDTLKVTNALYDAASRENAREIIAHFSPTGLSAQDLRKRAHAIDLAKTHAVGLRPSNYPEAWVEVFCQLAEEHGRQVCQQVAASLYRRAAAVVHMPQPDYPGARDLLIALRDNGWEVTIWTSGDRAVQEAKVERSGYKTLIDRVCVAPEKNVAALLQALESRDPSRVCVIGNSPRADIAPALAVGAWAFHVQHPTWEYDEAPLNAEHPRYVPVRSLKEIPTKLALVVS
ncbi:MAG: HAD family hydrolase [Limnochordia bacterium]|jgi:putative hydrolase of the HAD superfamily